MKKYKAILFLAETDRVPMSQTFPKKNKKKRQDISNK